MIDVRFYFQTIMPNKHSFNKYKGKRKHFERKKERLQILSETRRIEKQGQVKIGFWNARSLVGLEKARPFMKC